MPGTKENFQFIKGVGNVMKKPARKVGDSIGKGMKQGMKKVVKDSGKAIRQVSKGMEQGMKKAASNMTDMKRKKFFERKESLKKDNPDRSTKRNTFKGGGICKRGKGRAYGKNS